MKSSNTRDSQHARSVARTQSRVPVLDASSRVLKGLHVWCDTAPAVKENPDLLFAKCLVMPNSTHELFNLKQIEPKDPSDTIFTAKPTNVYNSNQNIDPLAYPDIGMIPHTNTAAVLDFIAQRYHKGLIYATAEPLLLAANPFKDLKNTTPDVIKQYRDVADVSKLPPHIFSIAREALENLHSVNKSQTIVVSGESGAGKTEATKQIMRYFAAAKSGTIDLRIQTAVLAGNPVLEAFGNAKTIRNDNSSRFGRFMQLQVAAGGGIEYGYVKNFLLEMSRIVTQDSAERSYHIFYQLLKGLSPAEKAKYKMLEPKEYKGVNTACMDVPSINDVADFEEVKVSLKSMGMTSTDLEGIFQCVSAVMLLSNVEVIGENREGVPNAAAFKNPETFDTVCELIGADAQGAKNGMFVKITQAAGKELRSVFTAAECQVLKDSMAKSIYNSLFNWIVKKLNSNIQPPNGFDKFMGMLDIFGFEVFQNNSLEQFFINITNEMLQKNFVDIVFEKEQRLYRAEGISSADLTWTTNAPIIEVLASKKRSIVSLLEDTCLAPGGDDRQFMSSTNQNLISHPHYAKAKIGSDINFIVTHTIGDIQYCASGFVAKNKDMLKAELVEVLQAANNPVTAELYKDIVVQRGKIGKNQLISAIFLGQLATMMELICSTEPHFVRCLKPNDQKLPLHYVPSKVLIQLHSLSILEALQLRNLGYSYRRPFEEFLVQFKFLDLGISEDKSLDPKDAATKMLLGSKMEQSEYQIGHTMVFLKHDAVKYLTQRQRELMAAWGPLISNLEAMYRAYVTKKEINERLPSIVRVQANIRALTSRRN